MHDCIYTRISYFSRPSETRSLRNERFCRRLRPCGVYVNIFTHTHTQAFCRRRLEKNLLSIFRPPCPSVRPPPPVRSRTPGPLFGREKHLDPSGPRVTKDRRRTARRARRRVGRGGAPLRGPAIATGGRRKVAERRSPAIPFPPARRHNGSGIRACVL